MNASPPTYAGTATYPALGDPVSGRILVQSHALRFESEGADCSLPLERLVIERARSGQICFTDPEQPDWTVFTGEQSILRNYFLRVRNPLRLQIEELQRTRESNRNLKLAAVLVLVCAVVAVSLWKLSGWVTNFLVSRVPVAWETQLSNKGLVEVQKFVKVVDDPQWPARFTPLTERLMTHLPKHPYRFQFRLVNHPAPNAFSLPGGTILICTGLFQMATSPEEIAGVLAHEMAHAIRRHSIRFLITSRGPYYGLRLFISDEHSFMSLISNSSQFLVRQSFSRDYEREADALAWQYLVAANIDPRGLITFFERLAAESVFGDLPALNLLSSHPPHRERIDELKKRWQALPRKSGFVDLKTP